MDIEEIKRRVEMNKEHPYPDFYLTEECDWLLQELEKLQQENERYKEGISEIRSDMLMIDVSKGDPLDKEKKHAILDKCNTLLNHEK